MISTRFGIILIMMLTVAIVPTFIHTYTGVVQDDQFRAESVGEDLAGLTSKSTDRQAAWVKDTFDSNDWIERRYTGRDGGNVLLFIARSYNLKRLYHHPEIGILRGIDLKKDNTDSLKETPEVPVHVLRHRSGNKGIAAYVLVYDGQFVENPMMLQVMSAFKLLFSARKPMTLLFVYEGESEYGLPLNESPAADVLAEALKSFLLQDK